MVTPYNVMENEAKMDELSDKDTKLNQDEANFSMNINSHDVEVAAEDDDDEDDEEDDDDLIEEEQLVCLEELQWKEPGKPQSHIFSLIDQLGTLQLPPKEDNNYEVEGEMEDEPETENSLFTTLQEDSIPIIMADMIDSTGVSQGPVKKKRRKKLLDINMTLCRYESVRRVSRRFGFHEVGDDEECNLFWTDLSVTIERVVSMKKWQKVNHFPGMSEICRKDCLARNLNRMFKLFPKEYNIFPKTWTLPADWGDLQHYARNRKNKTFILKPDTGCQGKGIWITKSPKDIKPTDNMICQTYISRPLLIDGYKFDLRLYVLVTSIIPLRIFVFKDGLARFTTTPYRDPTTANVANVYMHLTNYAVQKHSQTFVKDNEEMGTKRRITTVNCWLIQHGYDIVKIWEDIDDVIVKVIMSGQSVLQHNYKTCFPQHVETSACFEILGFDIMLDRKLRPYVIEVNHSPSFHTDSKLDKEIKEAMLWDTLQLANFGALDRRRCVEEDKKRIRQRLLKRQSGKQSSKEDQDREFQRFAEIALKYEDAHCGNFRRIFPSEDDEKYDKFKVASASLYQETAACKARLEHSKQLREEIRERREKLDVMLKPRNRATSLRPESPGKRERCRPTYKASPNVSTSLTKEINSIENADISEAVGKKMLHDTPVMPPSYSPIPILPSEENERLRMMDRRSVEIRNLGIVEAVKNLLDGSPGVLPSVSWKNKPTSLMEMTAQMGNANEAKVSVIEEDAQNNYCNIKLRDAPSNSYFSNKMTNGKRPGRQPRDNMFNSHAPSVDILLPTLAHGHQHIPSFQTQSDDTPLHSYLTGIQGKSLFAMPGVSTNPIGVQASWSRPVNHFKSCLNRAAQSLSDTPKSSNYNCHGLVSQTNCSSAAIQRQRSSQARRGNLSRGLFTPLRIFPNPQMSPKTESRYLIDFPSTRSKSNINFYATGSPSALRSSTKRPILNSKSYTVRCCVEKSIRNHLYLTSNKWCPERILFLPSERIRPKAKHYKMHMSTTKLPSDCDKSMAHVS